MTESELRSLMKISTDKGQKAVFDEYYNYVFTIVFNKLRSCASKEDIEECVSDVFADLFMEFDTDLKYIGKLTAYINVIAKNKAIDMYRSINAAKNNRMKISDKDIGTVSSDTDIVGSTESKEIGKIVLDLIEKLGEPDSAIIILKYYYGLTSSEIGKKLSISAVSVRKRSERALKRLKQLLSDNDITL